MSVRQNMAFSLKIRKVADDEINTKVEEAAAMLGLISCWTACQRSFQVKRQRVAIDGQSCDDRRCSCLMSRCLT